MTTDYITLSFGSTSVTLKGIDPKTIHPLREKNFTEYTLEDGSITVDESTTSKRLWKLKNDIPLTEQENADLMDLCFTYKQITLVENWVDPGTYSVHFRSLIPRLDSPTGSNKYTMELREL